MALHRLTRIVMGVPNVAEVSSYFREFGLSPASEPHHFAGSTAANSFGSCLP